jgi:hypothetical protein
MGKRTLTDVVLSFHVIPRAFTTALSRTPGDNDDDGCRLRAPRDNGVGDPFYIRSHTTRTHAHLGFVLFVVHQHVLAICERGDARLWRNFRKDDRSWMAWMGTRGRNKRGTWCQLTKPLKTQMVVVMKT